MPHSYCMSHCIGIVSYVLVNASKLHVLLTSACHIMPQCPIAISQYLIMYSSYHNVSLGSYSVMHKPQLIPYTYTYMSQVLLDSHCLIYHSPARLKVRHLNIIIISARCIVLFI